MTQPSLQSHNTGLRVFSACLLSALMIFMPFVQLTAASQRDSRVRSRGPESVSEANAQRNTANAAAADNLFVNSPIPKPAPEPPVLLAPNITATKVDSWDDTSSPDGKIDPGQVVTYNVTISNTGPDPATGVTFNDSVDTHTTLNLASIQTQPLAIADTATAFGNVRISTANGAVNLLANDCDPDDVTGPCNDNLTASGPATSTQNGNVVVNADGTFEYNPFPGFTGSDTFTYTIRDKGPDNIANNSDDKTDTATVTITVGPTLIWFINNSAGAGGDGRITSPFNSIAAFNAGAADDPGDIIFIYFGTGANYTGGLTLLNTQKVIGQGFLLATETGAAPAGSDNLPPVGSSPTIDNAGSNIITLAQNNTLRGFNTGNSGAAGTDISGTSFGTLTMSALSINGDGRALNLTTGTLAATVSNILASNTGSNDGVTLNAVGGSLTVSTNTTITNPGGDGIDISNAPMTTSYNFGTANVSKNAAGAGVILATNNAATTTSFTSLTITNSNGICLSANAAGTVNVTTGSITGTGTGITVTLTNTVLGMTFTSISSNTGANGIVISGGSGSLTSGTTNLQNNAGIGLSMSSSAVVANFGNTTVNSSAGDAVDLSSNTGNITFADLDMTPDSGLRGLDAQNNTGTLTVTSGDVTTSGAGTAAAVFIDGPGGRTPINITFTSITTSGVGAGGATTTAASIYLVDVSGTKFQVTGTTQVNTRAGTGVFVDNSTATNVQLGTTNVPNPSNAGGYGIRVEDSSSAVTISSATIDNANLVTGQTDGDNNFVPETDGDGDAIFLKNNTGSFTLNGGTLSNCGNDCIDTRDSQTLVLSGVTIDSPGIDVSGASGSGTGGHGIQAINLKGTNSITNSTITDWETQARDGLRYINHTSTASTLTVHGTTFSDSAAGSNAILVSGRDAANMTLNVGGASGGQPCTFSEVFGAAITHNAGDNVSSSATVNLNVINNSFTNTTVKGQNSVSARNLEGGKAIVVISGNTFDGVGRTVADTSGVIDVGTDGLLAGNFFHFTITNNIIKNIGDNIAGSCGGLPCTGKRAIDVFIDDNGVVGNDTAGAVDADDDVVIDGNVITNVQRNGIIFDVGSVYNGGGVAARITNNRVGIRADNTIDRVGIGTALAAGGEHAIRVENRNTNAKDLNILIQSNLFYNGNGGAGSALNNSGMLIRAQGTATMAATVASNTFNVNTSSTSFGINAQTTNGTTEVFCLDATGNTISAPSFGFGLSEVNGTMNIEQASSAALTAANGGATVSIVTGTPSFGVSCATPPAALNILRPEPREYVAAVATLIENGSATTVATAINSTEVSRPSLSTVADNAVTSFAREAGSLIPTTLASATTAATEVKSEARTHKSASDVRNQASEARVNTSDARAHHAKTEKAEAIRTESDARAHHANTARVITVPVGGGGTVNVSIGTLPAGDSVTITFQVTMDNPPNASPAQISNQGTVSGTNFSNVLTDDPSVGGANDPTVTPVDLFDSQTTLVSNNNPANQSENITFTATVAIDPAQLPTPPSPVTPTGTVTFKSDGVDIPTCIGVALNGSAQAQCTTSTLTPPSHNITAVYSGDSNYDPSTSNTVAQTILACVTNPIVNSTADPGDGTCDGANCTLREAVNNVCNGSTITFATGVGQAFQNPATITLVVGSGNLTIDRNVTIQGPNHGVTVVGSGNASHRVFIVNASKTATIMNMIMSGGNSDAIGGGAIKNDGTLTLKNVTVSGNATTQNGAGIHNSNVLNIVNSTISGNTATIDGGGIIQDGSSPTLTMINSTVSGNTANGFAGGLDLRNGTVTIINSTITGNHSDNDNNANGGAGGIRQQSATVTIHNTIVAGNYKGSGMTTPNDIEGTVSGSNNLIGDAATAGGLTHGVNGNIVGNAGSGTIAIATVLVTTLANNGGLTMTHALVGTGPAVEAGSNANLPVDTFDADGDANTLETLDVDQRGVGYPRVTDSADVNTTQTVDIGAYEAHPTIENIADQVTNEDTAINFDFNIGDDTGALITGGSVTATSSNTTLVPNANLVITDPAPPGGGFRNLSITPALNQTGTTTITVTVTATNGRTAVDTFDLNVTAQNDNPTLTNNTGITVNEGSTGNVIDNTKLKSDDVDNTPAQITFTVGTATANGTLKNNGVGLSSGGTFTQADIDGNLLTYDHNGSETTTDSFTFTVTDGAGGSIGSTTFNITVTPQNDNPTIGNNTGITVNEGSTGNIIDSAKLSVNDADNTPAQLTFTIGTAPANGTLKKSGGALAGGGTFTQQDINNNLLTYDHNGSETTSDSFTFTVSDGAGGSIGLTTFNITVTPQNDAPTVTTTVANLTYNENDPATPVDSGLTVTDSDNANVAGAAVSITTNFQSGQDVLAWVDNNLADNITDAGSTAQTIALTGIDTPANYQAALRAVTYVNSSENPSTLTRTLTFTVGDGVANGQATRNIDVNAMNDNPTLTTNAGLTVVNGGTGTIDNTKLKVDDLDNTPAQLTFTIGTATTNGTLKKGVATLSAGGTFTQADIDANQITYTHNGTATTTDSFTFTVSDGAGGSIGSTTFNITIGSPNLSINDAKVPEPVIPNTIDMTFTVALATPAGASGASVNFQTNNGSATAGTCGTLGADYTSSSGTVNFIAGEQVKTINVVVCSDGVPDDNETFTVTLSSPVNATIVDGTATGTITANTPGTLLISELRTSGPAGANDDFVEIYNNTNAAIVVPPGGYGLFKKGADCNGTVVLGASPVLVGTIPAGTTIPARGHFLFVGSAYSLSNYGGSGAAGVDVGGTLSADIETDANVGLFSTADITLISSVNRFDAVGFGLNTGGTCNLLREGSTLPSIAGNATTEHSYFRKMCDWIAGTGCTVNGIPKDSNSNVDDFWLADTAAITGRLGAPGPENLGSPIRRDNANNPGTGGIDVFLLASNLPPSAHPNRTRNTSEGAGSTPTQFGTMTLRYRVTNNTGAPVTRLRYRIVDASTAIQGPGPTADIRAITGTNDSGLGPINDPVTCAVSNGGSTSTPCNVNVNLTTLEQPPTQTAGGGYNSTLSSGTITLGNPLTTSGPTQSILINFKLGVEKTGQFRFYIIVEALP